MPVLRNVKHKLQAITVSTAEVRPLLDSGEWELLEDINVVSPQGYTTSVTPEQAATTSDRFQTEAEQIPGALARIGEERYGGTGNQIAAGIQGAARTLTGGLSDWGAQQMGMKKHEIRGIREEHPITSTGSEIAGAILPMAVTGGAAGLGEAGVLAKASWALPANAAVRAGALAERGALAVTGSKVAATAARGAAEGAAFSGISTVANIGLSDKEYTGEAVLSEMGHAVLLGGAVGGSLGLGVGLVGKVANRVSSGLSARAAAKADDAAKLEQAAVQAHPYTPVSAERHVAKVARAEHKVLKIQAKLEPPPPGIKAKPINTKVVQADLRAAELELAAIKAGGPKTAVDALPLSDDLISKSHPALNPNSVEFKAADQVPVNALREAEVFRDGIVKQAQLDKLHPRVPGQESGIGYTRTLAKLVKPERAVKHFIDSGMGGSEYLAHLGKKGAAKFNAHLKTYVEALDELGTRAGTPYAKLDELRGFSMFNAKPASLETGVEKALGLPVDAGTSMKERAFNAASFGLAAGETLGIVPDTGVGKVMAGMSAMRHFGKGGGIASLIGGIVPGRAGFAVRTALGLSSTVGKSNDYIAKGVQGFIKGAGRASPGYVPAAATITSRVRYSERPTETKHPYKQRLAELADAVSNPEKTKARIHSKIGHVMEADPQVANRIVEGLMAAVNYLYERAPKPPRVSPFGPDNWEPSETQLAKFARMAAVADNVLTLVDDFENGRVTKEAVETARALSPTVYAKLQQEILNNVDQIKEKVDYSGRVQLSLLFRVPADASMEPDFLATMQSNFAEKTAQEQPADGPGPKHTAAYGNLSAITGEPTTAQKLSQVG